MLWVVADEREEQAEQIGRVIGARLRAAAKALGLKPGQVHYRANQGQAAEIVSLATVSALLRGSIASPSVANTLAVARALGLDLNQAVGIAPMPEIVQEPVEDGSVTRQDFEALRGVVYDLVERLEKNTRSGQADQAVPERKRRRRPRGTSK